ncbi:MAG: helix-turn-helix transcriptional regulator [Nannocystaceae bacterium]|nr:helix-turn-helix transcriptional regulator [Nannocystaceae bacterium]
MKNDVREHRRGMKMTQQQMADALEVSRQSIIAIERGKYDPSLPLAFKIAGLFGVSIEELFEP